VKQAQRSLFDHETLLAKGNSNRQEAKELSQLIYHLKNSSLSVDPELSRLEARCAELEKELGDVKAAIDRHKSILAQILDANGNCWPKSEKVEPSEVASRTFLDQPKKTSNKSQKLMLSG